jgi:hypothetical protein
MYQAKQIKQTKQICKQIWQIKNQTKHFCESQAVFAMNRARRVHRTVVSNSQVPPIFPTNEARGEVLFDSLAWRTSTSQSWVIVFCSDYALLHAPDRPFWSIDTRNDRNALESRFACVSPFRVSASFNRVCHNMWFTPNTDGFLK